MHYFRMKYQNLTKNYPKLDEVAILLKRSIGSPNSAFNLREVKRINELLFPSQIIRKHLCQSLFFNKVAGLGPTTLLKKRLWYRSFRMI